MKAKATVRPIDLPAGRRTLVVSDIHGNLPLLKGVLAKAGFCREDILIVLGDMMERSTGSLDTLRYIMALSRTHTVYTLLGNCDNVILSFLREEDRFPDEAYDRLFRSWGERSVGAQMAKRLGIPLNSPADYPAARAAFREEFRPELDFLTSLPQIYVNQDYLFVHGGVPREDRLEELDAYGCMKNDDFLGQGHSFRRWVIVGHWPVTLYDPKIPSADPILLYDRHIASIDGGCTLKWDGQLNALVLPETPGGEFSWFNYDGFPTVTALDPQAASEDSINIRWSEHEITVLDRGPEFCRCRHNKTGRELDILTEYIYDWGGKTVCEDSTDYRLPVERGDVLSVVRRTSRGLLAKKKGVTGWYAGRVAEEEWT